MSKNVTSLMDEAIKKGDTLAIMKALAAKGYKPAILLKGPNTEIVFNCEAGGKGTGCTHVWKATPLEALSEDGGCPHCRLDRIVSGPPTEVSEAELIAGIKKQHSAMSKSNKLALKRSKRVGSTVGKYAV